MRALLTYSALTFALCAHASNTHANSTPKVITSCGASVGQAYFHHNNIVTKKDSGWSEDKVTNGSFIVQKIGENYDLIYRDQLGLQSSTDNGAVIFPTHENDTSLSLILVYPSNGNSETYNFQHLGSADAEVSWTSTKVGTLIVKSGVFYAKCEG